YLALLRLPSDPSTWLSVGPDALVLRRCMYWCSLREAPANMNERSTTIHVPISQVLDPGELGRLVAAAAREEAL
ncbi:MAG: hypothetical protein KF729_38950, partial [Sandaracinaceae bacterium]|nr:hypothetical protein [Sandaracinaceae bacterium]